VTLPRLRLAGPLAPGESHRLPEEERRYLLKVLRLRAGETICCFDGRGGEYEGLLFRDHDGTWSVRIIGPLEPLVPTVRIALAQALPKAPAMEAIIRKATELGAGLILPFTARRSVARPEGERARAKRQRWLKIAAEAARQCRRSDVPEVGPLRSWSETLELAADFPLRILFWEEERERDLKAVLRTAAEGGRGGCFLVVGPEGGLTREEVEEAAARGFRTVSLGRRLLKADTAALTALAVVQYELGGFFRAPAGEGT